MLKFIHAVVGRAADIDNGRTALDVLDYTLTELGELAEEIIIARGASYKAPGKDGVAGEAIDLALCLIDLLRLSHSGDICGIASDTVREALASKCARKPRAELRRITACLGGITNDLERHGQSTGLILAALGAAIRIVCYEVRDADDAVITAMVEPKLAKWASTAKASA
ncbi:hypothetical protein AB9K35_17720 [Leisingera sp. XS_AS12]|uniref:hypothetical protein n=1 Tax=Leisingera sp. XS_AS12 TaxID=3241294 RepID=UPI003513EE6D